ncbi:CCNL2 isoform 2, partial [Pan troglodytes]
EEAPRRIRDVINVFHRLRQLREKKPCALSLAGSPCLYYWIKIMLI